MVKINFGDEESFAIPAGRYLVKVSQVDEEEGEKAPYLHWQFETVSPEGGHTIHHNTSLSPKSLPFLRRLLESLGIKVPSKSIDLKLSQLIGKKVGVEVENEDYQGSQRPRCRGFFPPEEFKGVEEPDLEEDEEEEVEEEDASNLHDPENGVFYGLVKKVSRKNGLITLDDGTEIYLDAEEIEEDDYPSKGDTVQGDCETDDEGDFVASSISIVTDEEEEEEEDDDLEEL